MTLYSRIIYLLSILFLPQMVLAHSPIKGIGHFLNGMLHPILVPSQLIIIVALGLLYGQHEPEKNKLSILLFLTSTIIGLVLTSFFIIPDISLLLLILAVIIGLTIITSIAIPQPIFMLFAIVVGIIVGFDSAQLDLETKAMVVTLFGSGVSIYFLLLYAMALSETLSHKQWQIIAIRIIASWLSASAIMVLALNFSYFNK